MCKFVSGYVSKNGEIYCNPEVSDSHSEIAEFYNLRDNESNYYNNALAKFEMTPPADTKDWQDFSKWKVYADETETPDWFDAERIREYVSGILRPMFVTDSRQVLLNGCWIFDGEKASVKKVIRGKIVAVVNGAYLEGAILEGANLRGANLQGANLRGAYLEGANLEGANLGGANLQGANLQGANLQGANLQGADLKCANLYGANLQGADLYGANLKGANLQGADLKGANLYGANLQGAILEGANLKGASNVKLPDGWVINKDGFATSI